VAVKAQQEIEQNWAAVKAERLDTTGGGYEKGYIDGLHTALGWVLEQPGFDWEATKDLLS
jgi:hypothetical protein